jgi:hypothetical protein
MRILVAGLLIACAVHHVDAEQQPEAASANLYRAAVVNLAAWVEKDLPGGRPVIEVDPRIRVTGGRGLPAAGETLHPPEALAGVSVDKMVVVMTLDRARQCTGLGVRTCRTEGRFVGVTFEVATIQDETATVTALVRVSRAPTPDELARLQGSPALTRFSEEAGSATLFRLTLARRNGLWSVTNRTRRSSRADS